MPSIGPAIATANNSIHKKTALFVLLVISLTIGWSERVSAWPDVYPVGTTRNEGADVFQCYALFTPARLTGSSSTFYLINMAGAAVHTWQVPFIALHGRLLPNGNLIVIGYNQKDVPKRPGGSKYRIGGAAGWIAEFDWDGKPVRSHADLTMHHDFVTLPNGHLLYLAWEPVPAALQKKVRGGIKESEFKDGTMFNEVVVEVDGQGRRIWEWHANEHLDPDVDIIGPFYRRREWCHANTLALTKTGDLLLTCRSTDSIILVQRSTGKVVFRWGNSTTFDKATQQLEYHGGTEFLGGPHDAREIPDGYPGAGHLTCYNNRMNDGDFLRSQVVEVDRETRQVKWKTPAQGLGRKHFSDFLGSAERLPNGNTMVCDGANGRFFQITKNGKIVWEYVNPYVPATQFQGAVLKIQTYKPDYCPQFATLTSTAGDAPGNVAIGSPATKAKPVLSPREMAMVVAALCVVAGLIGFLALRPRPARK